MSELDNFEQLQHFDSHGLLTRAAAWPARRDATRQLQVTLPCHPDAIHICLLPAELLSLGRLAAASCAARVPNGRKVWIYPAATQQGTQPRAIFAEITTQALHSLGCAPTQAELDAAIADAPRQDLAAIADADRHSTDILLDLIALFAQGTAAAQSLVPTEAALNSALAALTPNVPLVANPAKQLAQRLHERLPVFWGSDQMGLIAAHWAMRQEWLAERAALSMTSADVARLGVLARLPRYWPNAAYFVQLGSATISDAELTTTVTRILARRRFPTQVVALPAALSDFAAHIYLLELGEWLALYTAYLNQADPTSRTAHKILFAP